MRLDFDNSRTRAADAGGMTEEDAVQQMTTAELFAQFFQQQNGKEMTPWQTERLLELCRRMEENNEAD